MRIWLVNHYAVPPSCNGGTRHYSLAKELIRCGHEACVVAANFSHFAHDYIAKASVTTNKCEVVAGVPFCWIPVPKYFGNSIKRFWSMIVFAWRTLRKKYLPGMHNPDVIIGSTPHLFAAFAAYVLARRLKVPFVLEVRDIWPETLVLLGKISPHHPVILLMGRLEKYLYKHADSIITLLPNSSLHISANGADAEKIHWLPNFVDVGIVPENFLSKTGPAKDNGYMTFMYSGTHGLANNLELVLKVALLIQENPNWKDKIRIVLVGEGPHKQALMEEVAAKKISIIKFLPQVAKSQVYAVLQQADAFLMLLKPSPLFKWGISPNKLFDYMLMSRPIIFGVSSSNNPVAAATAGLTINPESPAELAQAMKSLADTPLTDRIQMGENARNYVIENHSVTGIVVKLENILSAIV